jgi:hypothetical protein
MTPRDDRQAQISFSLPCKNCGIVKPTRSVEVMSALMGGASRGFYNFCFDCVGPTITFRATNGRIMETPLTDDAKKDFLRSVVQRSHQVFDAGGA